MSPMSYDDIRNFFARAKAAACCMQRAVITHTHTHTYLGQLRFCEDYDASVFQLRSFIMNYDDLRKIRSTDFMKRYL